MFNKHFSKSKFVKFISVIAAISSISGYSIYKFINIYQLHKKEAIKQKKLVVNFFYELNYNMPKVNTLAEPEGPISVAMTKDKISLKNHYLKRLAFNKSNTVNSSTRELIKDQVYAINDYNYYAHQYSSNYTLFHPSFKSIDALRKAHKYASIIKQNYRNIACNLSSQYPRFKHYCDN